MSKDPSSQETEHQEEEREEPRQILVDDVKWQALQEELSDCKDKYFRLLAEQENTRKRLTKERDQLTRHGIQNVLIEFLDPIDQMQNALGFAEKMSDEVKHWARGFQMILTQFKEVLALHSVKEFKSLGKPFNPHYHEAVEMLETEEEEPGVVVKEIVRGYVIGEKVLRPARVAVSKEPSVEEKERNEEEN